MTKLFGTEPGGCVNHPLQEGEKKVRVPVIQCLRFGEPAGIEGRDLGVHPSSEWYEVKKIKPHYLAD
ncbi:hypothetical protein ABH19_08005 [Leptospirillum sp. Group II 'CF-1']|nr:hypothetical protein ABH19_08005 [Leptospirillum sp. Group II 'CF-1']